ncbi:MAG TPA: fluoride efflux transporter CrcB [Micromonosporaceae bacterium]|nr:fluoride efflux transporter CrcB [Micromonosporaceae bacterium]
MLAVVSAGGVAGALARYAVGVAFPHPPGGFPWSTFGVNVSGCLLIGVLMALVTDARRPHPLLRPFLGTGLLGGYTTFSSYIVEMQHLVFVGATGTALAYLAGTLLSALTAVYTGSALTRLVVRGARRCRPVGPGCAGTR